MVPNQKLQPYEKVANALKEGNLNFSRAAQLIGERPDKVSVAVRCTNGSGKRSIEIRNKIAELIGMDPLEIWDPSMMSPTRKPAQKRHGYSKAVPIDKLTEEEWKTMEPRERVRSLLTMEGMTVRDLAQTIDVPYSSLTGAIYGNHNIAMRRRVAEYLNIDPSKVWPNLDNFAQPRIEVEDAIKQKPGLKTFFGFGDMTRTIKMNSAKNEK